MKDANQVLQALKEGNARFLEGKSSQCSYASLQKIKDYAKSGQSPKAVILCCSDSRAPVEIIFDQDIGDIFVIRVAGNVVAPSLVGSVEFAVNAFKTSLVIVMGHSDCGAVRATLDYIDGDRNLASDNIHDIVSRIKPHISYLSKIKGLSDEDKMHHATHANVIAGVDQLTHSSRLLEELASKGEITIIGAVLELATGRVEFIQ